MFEAVELGQKVSKSELEAALPELRERLLAVQRRLRESSRPVIVIVSGVEGAGKSEVVNRLNEWLDSRGIETHAFWQDSDEERERPRYWRFWRALPPRGAIAVMFGSWYTFPIINRVFDRWSETDLDEELHRIAFFERMLAQDGAVLIKFWFHLSKEVQRKRLKAAAKRSRKSWKMSPDVKRFFKSYDRFAEVSERAIRFTDTAESPWHVVEATDVRHRDLSVGRIVLHTLEEALGAGAAAPAGSAPVESSEPLAAAPAGQTILDHVDTSPSLSAKRYRSALASNQRKLNKLAWKAWDARRSTVVLFEGWDASGKGGAIRRVTAPMDARLYRTISVAAPTDEERAHHYLWRFWRHIPRAGHVTLYDRSWYGRVLVERVEGFAQPEDWFRAYREINEFEEQLADHGIILVKFWLHIDSDEQLRRFEERQRIAWKQHKITEEDWRNREKWDAYKVAVSDMIARTSTARSPWTIVPGNDKRHARVQVLETVCDAMDAALS